MNSNISKYLMRIYQSPRRIAPPWRSILRFGLNLPKRRTNRVVLNRVSWLGRAGNSLAYCSCWKFIIRTSNYSGSIKSLFLFHYLLISHVQTILCWKLKPDANRKCLKKLAQAMLNWSVITEKFDICTINLDVFNISFLDELLSMKWCKPPNFRNGDLLPAGKFPDKVSVYRRWKLVLLTILRAAWVSIAWTWLASWVRTLGRIWPILTRATDPFGFRSALYL